MEWVLITNSDFESIIGLMADFESIIYLFTV